jgi:hypothetical protein
VVAALDLGGPRVRASIAGVLGTGFAVTGSMANQAQVNTVSDKKTRETKVQVAKPSKSPAKPLAMPAPDEDTLICLPIG